MRYCFNCGTEIGKDRYNNPYSTCGKTACETVVRYWMGLSTEERASNWEEGRRNGDPDAKIAALEAKFAELAAVVRELLGHVEICTSEGQSLFTKLNALLARETRGRSALPRLEPCDRQSGNGDGYS